MKLIVDEDVKLHLEELKKKLAGAEGHERKFMSDITGGDGCGGQCRFTCAHYCRDNCYDACDGTCTNECSGTCSGDCGASCTYRQIFMDTYVCYYF